MKNVYYKRLLADRFGLSASERIVYSFLVYQSLCNLDDVWDSEGKCDIEIIKEYGDSFPLPFFMFDDFSKFCYGVTISRNTMVSQSTVSRAINKLITYGIINIDKQTINHNYLYENGFFDLKGDLKGELLIFYSFLLDIKGDGNVIFANREKIASIYHVEMKDIRDYLQRLKKLGLIERDNNNKLIIK